MTSMPAMHKHVHQRAEQEGKENERAKHVGAVLGEQERAGDDEKADEDKRGARFQKTARRVAPVLRVIMDGHCGLLFHALLATELGRACPSCWSGLRVCP